MILLEFITDPEGHTITYKYNAAGEIIEKKSLDSITLYQYDGVGNLIKEILPETNTTEYSYGQSTGLLLKKTLVNPDDISQSSTTRFDYDSQGRLKKEVSPNLYDSTLENSSDDHYSGDHGKRIVYNSNGLVSTVIDAENNETVYTHDSYGNILTETKPTGGIYEYTYDIMKRLIKTHFKDSINSEKVLLEEYQYNILDNKNTQKIKTQYLNSIEKAITIFEYDYDGRLIKTIFPDGSTESTIYNLNGTVKQTTSKSGSSTYFEYDGLNRLTKTWKQVDVNQYIYSEISYRKNGKIESEKVGNEFVASVTSYPQTYTTTLYNYYSNDNLQSKTDSAGRSIVFEYDLNGNVVKETTKRNSEESDITEYEYNFMDKPTEVTTYAKKEDIYGYSLYDSSNMEIKTIYTYDKNKNIKTKKTPTNELITYEYDNLNRNISTSQNVRDEYDIPTIAKTERTYTFDGQIKTEKDAKTNITNFIYNKRGSLIEIQKDNLDVTYVTKFYYDRAERKIGEVSPENYEENKEMSEMNHTGYILDKMGRIKLKYESFVDPNTNNRIQINTKAYKYDSSGNIIKELDGEGYKSSDSNSVTVDDRIENGYGTTYKYNLINQIVEVLDPISKDLNYSYSSKYKYDVAGHKIYEESLKGTVEYPYYSITNYNYNNAGYLEKTTIQKTSNSPLKTIKEATYDLLGNIITKTDGEGNITTIEYNSFNKPRKIITSGDSTMPQNIIRYQYNEIGLVRFEKDSSDKTEIYNYDQMNRIIYHKQNGFNSDGNECDVKTEEKKYDINGNLRFEYDFKNNGTGYVYDDFNRVIQIVKNEKTASISYDKNGNKISEIDWRGNKYSFVYDPINRIIEKKDPYEKSIEKIEYNSNNSQIKSLDSEDKITTFEYDKNNRLVKKTDPLNHSNSQYYDNAGNVYIKKDGKEQGTIFTYNELNQLESVKNNKGEITTYSYDGNGNVKTQTDDKNQVITYYYNSNNKLIERVDDGGSLSPRNKVESYTYYSNGNLKTKTDRNGETTNYVYFTDGKLKSETVGNLTISYTYDNNGNLLTITDVTGTTIRTYDKENRVKSKYVPNIGLSTFEYDITQGLIDGHIAESSTDSKGNKTTKIYDKAGRLKFVKDGSVDSTTFVSYNYYDDGTLKEVIYPNNAKEEYIYKDNNLLQSLTNKNPDGTVLDLYTYDYDNANNQTSKNEVINGVSKGETKFTYDNLNRLEKVVEPNDSKTTTYTFDNVGNRKTETITTPNGSILNTYEYNNQNRLTSVTTTVNQIITQVLTYSYDSNGNQLNTIKTPYIDGIAQASETVVTNNYDKLNQLITTITSTNTVNNVYNGEGLRVAKIVDNNVTNYLYEYDKVVLEVDNSNNQIARNIYGTNLLSRNVDNTTLYYMYNGHADVTALIDNTGVVKQTYYYDSFGNILEQAGDVNNSINYAGYQYDKETGLYYLNARMYDPKIARFMQEDTYRGDPNDPLSLNLYTYCHNEPIMYTDPTGHFYDQTISYGMGSNEVNTPESWNVYFVQRSLESLYGFDTGGSYGYYDDKTLEYVYRFKRECGLPEDSTINLQIWEMLSAKTENDLEKYERLSSDYQTTTYDKVKQETSDARESSRIIGSINNEPELPPWGYNGTPPAYWGSESTSNKGTGKSEYKFYPNTSIGPAPKESGWDKAAKIIEFEAGCGPGVKVGIKPLVANVEVGAAIDRANITYENGKWTLNSKVSAGAEISSKLLNNTKISLDYEVKNNADTSRYLDPMVGIFTDPNNQVEWNAGLKSGERSIIGVGDGKELYKAPDIKLEVGIDAYLAFGGHVEVRLNLTKAKEWFDYVTK